MKNIYLILVSLFFISCSKDDVECYCDVKVTDDGTSFYYVSNVPTDCNGNYDKDSLPINDEHFIVGLVNCD